MSLDIAWNKVKDFHKTFSLPLSDSPCILDSKRVASRYKWMLEELDEFKEATTLTEQADAMIDLIYYALGTMVEMGVEPNEIFELVHEANMKKKWDDGLVYFNDDEKVIKSQNWISPNNEISKIINEQLKESKK